MIRSSYACAVGQWLHVKTTTRIRAGANEASEYVFPSTPGSEKSGAAAPIARVGWSPGVRPGTDKLSSPKTIIKSFIAICLKKLQDLASQRAPARHPNRLAPHRLTP